MMSLLLYIGKVSGQNRKDYEPSTKPKQMHQDIHLYSCS